MEKENNFFIVASSKCKKLINATVRINENKHLDLVAIFNLDETTRDSILEEFEGNPTVYIDTEENATLEYLRKKCVELKKVNNNLLVIIYYDKTLAEDDETVGKELKQLSNDLKIDVELLIQCSYEVKEDYNSNVFDNTKLMQYADNILLSTGEYIIQIDLEEGKIIRVEDSSRYI